MIEHRRIVELWKRGESAALATLVRVEGSSYRAAGARLLVTRTGAYAGAISGGCLEAEIVRRAGWLVRSGAVVEQYSTAFDSTAEIPFGLGCGGTVDVLLEPAGTEEFQALLRALEESLAGESRTVTTVFVGNGALQRSVRDVQGRLLFGDDGLDPNPDAFGFTESLRPPQRLFLFGGGDDVQPVVRMASLLGWTVIVFDSRSRWARPARFPEAEAVVAGSTLESLRPRSSDAVVLMSHSFEQDRCWLEQVLPSRPKYLGLLGSRHRSALLLAEAAQSLGWPLEQACEAVFSPVGLDLGGDGAEAIALSIVAEVQACTQGKLGQSRRLTPAAVAEQIARGGASRYLQAQCAL